MSDYETGTSLELLVAGVISTFPPHDQEHPIACLPIAKEVLRVIGEWVPEDDDDRAADDEPSEAELIRYYHSGGGEDPVSRQQIRDAGRPGL